MRTLDPLALYLGAGRQALAGNFEAFMKMFEDSYQPMVSLTKSKGLI
jgi:glutaconate CoA-transferase subunit B